MSDTPKFELRQKVRVKLFPKSPGRITDIRQSIGWGCPQYLVSTYSGWLGEYEIEEVPDTVTLELSRRSAEKIAAYVLLPLLTDFDRELIEAARKALG